MDVLTHILALVLGAAAVWLIFRQQRSTLEARLAQVSGESVRLREERAVLQTTLENERQTAAEKIRLLDQAQARLSDTFKALSSEALQNNNASFLHLAKAT